MGSGVHPTSYPIGIGGHFTVGKWPWSKADQSPTFSTQVKNVGAIPSYSHTYLWHSAV
jgi:hypothetical protein